VPDKSLDDVYLVDYDIVILPGGLEGSESLAKSEKVKERLERQIKRDAYIGAICAAPCAFKSHGLLPNKRVTSHPCKAEYLKDGYQYSEDRVVVDDKLITSRAPGTAFEFAFAIITTLYDESKVDEINTAMFVKK
jgi:DJ-1